LFRDYVGIVEIVMAHVKMTSAGLVSYIEDRSSFYN